MKLLGLSLGTLLIAFMLFMTVRMWGEGQTYKPFDAPFFKDPAPQVIVGWEQNYLLEKHPDLVLWVDVYRATNDNILVKPWADRNKLKKDLEQTANPSRPLLKDLLLQFPRTRFVINCNDNVQDIQNNLFQVIDETKSSERILLASDYNTILISVKKLSPMIVFGSTVADMTRLKTFEAMWLLPAAPFEGDVLFAPLTYRNREMVTRDIVQEMKKRFKKVILGPLKSKEDVEKARALQADVLFVEDPFLALSQ